MAARKKKPTAKGRTKRKTGQNRTPKKDRKPVWLDVFLTALAQTANVSAAALQASISRSVVYEYRDKHADFAARWDEALEIACDALELEARRRARDGVQRMKFHQGQAIMIPVFGPDGRIIKDEATGEPLLTPYVEHEYSDTLMIFLLKAHRPQKYRENVRHEHTGEGGGPIEFIEIVRTANPDRDGHPA